MASQLAALFHDNEKRHPSIGDDGTSRKSRILKQEIRDRTTPPDFDHSYF